MSRLDRLISLLETGSSSYVRLTAAEQIAEIQKSHPEELYNLLDRVYPYLRSKKWDTRSAAIKCIGLISENTLPWDPNSPDHGPSSIKVEPQDQEVKQQVIKQEHDIQIKQEDRDTSLGINPPKQQEADTSDMLSFASLDIASILKKGRILLGSGGTEFDIHADDVADPVLRLSREKRNVTARLGLGGDFMDDIVNESDFSQVLAPGSIKQERRIKSSPAPEDASSKPQSASSSRLKAMAKRKAKADAKAAHSTKVRVLNHHHHRIDSSRNSPSAESPSSVSGDSKVVVEHKKKDIHESFVRNLTDGNSWPFDGFCELLMLDLFSPQWETRHGATGALREVIRAAGSGAGRVPGKCRQDNDALNNQWLENVACRLCCIFALDRFGDYVSDQVVAPIREAAAQTLGAVVCYLSIESFRGCYKILYQLVMQNNLGLDTRVWQACHGGLLGLKYLVAVRKKDVASDVEILDGALDCVLFGLREMDDDVRAVSAATLIPIADEFIHIRSNSLSQLLSTIWDCLEDTKDDLSASTASVMDLLGKLCSFPETLDLIQREAASDPAKSFEMLIPRLFPFLRHPISSVRKAILQCLDTFLGAKQTSWINGQVLHVLFQDLLFEQNEGILSLAKDLWYALCSEFAKTSKSDYTRQVAPLLPAMINLVMTPIGVARHMYRMDVSLLPSKGYTDGKKNGSHKLEDNCSPMNEGGFGYSIDGPMIMGDITLIGLDTFLRAKITSSCAIGYSTSLLGEEEFSTIIESVLQCLYSSFSTQRIVAGLILNEFAEHVEQGTPQRSKIHNALVDFLNAPPPPMYEDLVPLLKVVKTQCQVMCNVFAESGGISRSSLPYIAPIVLGEHVENSNENGQTFFSIEIAQNLVSSDYEELRKIMNPGQKVKSLQPLKDCIQNITTALSELQNQMELRNVSIYAAVASGVVTLGVLPKKLNPLIRSLVESVKNEEHYSLQHRAAISVAQLIDLCAKNGKGKAADKVVKNLCGFLCVDTSDIPEFHENENLTSIIFSVKKEQGPKDAKESAERQREQRQLRLKKRGSQMALQEFARLFGSKLFEKASMAEQCMIKPLETLHGGEVPDGLKDPQSDLGQQIVDAFGLTRFLLQYIDPSLWDRFLDKAPEGLVALKSDYSVLRYSASKYFAVMCKVMDSRAMVFFVDSILPLVSNNSALVARQGAIESIYHIVDIMGNKILPYVVFLIVPVLGRMSDSNKDVRMLATTTFAQIIKLVPLESGIPDPPDMPAKLLEGRDKERKFISQMLDVSKIEPFQLPVKVKATLRKYQQEGVNWLAFLNRYHLHGVLCDDMGLGKTLQTICIVASDHYLRAQEFAKSQAVDMRPLPSLIICPPTLTGHWLHEIMTYAPFLKVLVYVGNPAQRGKLKSQIYKHDIVITSYDITRNDTETISKHDWNYVVLDEGHIIKNSQSKLTKAVKELHGYHRLILSGTPIQNNVLELWSLFDFLMPGFLGSEKSFNERFAKPIAASRNAKTSSKEQEAGALALEALHKQVLPFLLRRLKENVLEDLPPKIIQDYYAELGDVQRLLYDDFLSKQQGSLAKEVGDTGNKENKKRIFQSLQYMRKLCNHPYLVVNPKHPMYKKVTKMLEVDHRSLRDVSLSPKLGALQTLLLDCGIGAPCETGSLVSSGGVISQHRALVFCQLKDMLDIVEKDLLQKLMPSVSYLRLDGSVDGSKRHEIVQKFNADPSIDVLLLTTHVGGLGLNLTGADTVIFVEHDWNPMKDLQAMDRAHRIGQKKVVNVYRLITRDTVEEKIMGLQRFKLNIASSIVNQQNSGLETMDSGQLLDLFSGPAEDELQKQQQKTSESSTGVEAADAISGGVNTKAISELGELWDEKEYEEYNLDSFIKNLN